MGDGSHKFATYYALVLISLGLIACSKSDDANKQEEKSASPEYQAHSKVLVKTTLGDIEIELFPEKAPITVKNFLNYVNKRFYDGSIFHRVIPGFVIQGGGFDEYMQQKATDANIQNEADNKLENLRGTIAMARARDPHSASSQFFINLKDNHFLDFRSKNAGEWGYVVFGKVTKGMEVVDKIAKEPTKTIGRFSDVPATPVVITASEPR